MSKKPRNKSVAPAAAGAQKWEQELISAAFCDETWKASVVSVVANSAADLPHVETLVTAVSAGSRKLFTVVSKAHLIALVNEFGNVKAKKPKEVPLFVEVCEACKEFVDRNEEIPLPLLAKLIKFKLLEVKDKDLKRQERELKGGGEKAGKKDKKGDKSPAKGKAGKKTPEPPAAKAGTKLRKRGEEDLDAKYIDDEPDDGPQHYVILTGLHHPHLATYIAETGIEQDCLIRVLREDYSDPPPPSPRPDAKEEKPKDDKQLAAEAAALEQKLKVDNELKTFWRDAPLLMKHASETSKLHNIALLLYKVRRELNMQSDADANTKLQIGAILFDDISCMIYQLLDVKRQWLNYLAHQKLIKVPILTTPSAESGPVATSPTKEAKGAEQAEWWQKLTTDIDMRRYNELMSVIPAESTSVELMLHCMLEQVNESTKTAEQASGGATNGTASTADNPVMEHLLQLSLKLMISEAEREQLRAEFGVSKKSEAVVNQPVLINYHDDVTKRLKHLDKVGSDFVPLEAELAMLKRYPIMQLLNPECVSDSVMKEHAARLHELLHFLNNGSHSHAEIDHCLKQFVLECMELTAVNADDQVVPLPVSHKQVDIPWDDPYPYFLHQIPCETDGVKSDTEVFPSEDEVPLSASKQRKDSAGSNRSLMSVHFDKELQQSTSEHFDSLRQGSVSSSFKPLINNPQKRDLDQWCFTEHFDANILPQVLKKALDTHPFVDVYDHKRDGTRVLALHSALSDRLYNRQDWHTEIHSRVGFRHYLEYVSNLIGDWTIQEEAKYQAKLLAKEVEDSQKEFDDEKQKAQAADRKSRSKSPKKSPARGKSPSHSNDSSVERPKSGVVIRNGSLKAWKAEQDQLKAEQEAANEKKKRGRSPKEKEKEKEEKASASPGPPETRKEHRPSSLRRAGDTAADTKDTDLFTFAGYDITSLVQSASTVSHMHPTDGGKITISTNNFIEGSASVHTTLSKDGHYFSVHVLEPHVAEEREAATDEASIKTAAHPPNADTLPASTSHIDLAANTGVESEQDVDAAAGGSDVSKVSPTKPTRDNKSPVGAFGSFVARFADGLCVSVSAYGNTGRPLGGHKYEPQPYVPPVITPVADKATKEPTSARGRKANKDHVDKDKDKAEKDKSTERAESSAERDETSSETSAAIEDKSRDSGQPPFQQLHVSCPDGLYVTFVPPTAYGGKCERSEEVTETLWVRQKYALRSKGVNSCEALRQQAMKEASRVITCDGTVIKTMLDGTAEVLYADGKVVQYVFKSSLLTPTTPRVSSAAAVTASQTEVKKTTSSQGAHSKKDKAEKAEPEHVEEPVKKGYWITTLPSGERYASSEADGSSVPVKCALISETCDPATKQRIRTREDKVVTVMHVDGSQIVEHVDGTRITTYFQKTRVHLDDEANKETGEIGGTCTQVTQFIVVECPGYASVTYNNARPDCQVEFADRTVLHAQPDCSYHVEQADGGLLMIEADGTAVYFPCPDYTSPPRPSSEPHMQYIMRHFADDLLQTVDDNKNLFQVRADGFAGALLASSGRNGPKDGEEVKQDEYTIPEEDAQVINLEGKGGRSAVDTLDGGNRKVVTYDKHAPRFFVVNGDGSGVEVMRYQDLYEAITAAEDDPTSAVLMDPLPDQPNILGISVLRPHTRTISHQWLLNYRQQSITPQGLVSRDWASFPASEHKKPGPVFGTNVGRGVNVGAVPALPPPPLALPRCPNMLEIRQVLQYLPSSKLRDSLKQCFYDYGQFVHNRDRQRSLMATKDPRSEDERLVAMDVTLNAAASANAATADPDELLADGGGVVLTGATVLDLSGSVKHRYETVTHMAAAPPPVLTPQPKRTRADWERIDRELREAQENKVAIRNRNIPPYFESDMGKAFLRTQARDVSTLMDDLSKEEMLSSPKNGAEHTDSDSATRRVESSASAVGTGGRGSPGSDTRVPVQLSAKSAALIPVHMSEAQVASARASVTSQGEVKALQAVPAQPSDNSLHAGDSLSVQRSMALPPTDSTSVAADSSYLLLPPSSPYVSRPFNPTPAHATLGTAIDNKAASDYSLLSRVPLPRADVRIPIYLSSRRPNPQPNQKFQSVEEPVRRKVVNIGTVCSSVMASEMVKGMRGFELLPASVNFGTLKEGNTYQMSVLMKNVGTDTCSFRIKQPPPSTGIKVHFIPGPVAAGLTTSLTVEIYAIAAGIEGAVGVAKISHSVTIVTETDILSLPVTAIITADEYNQIARTNMKLSPRVKPVTAARPPPAGKLYTRSQNYKDISFEDVDL